MAYVDHAFSISDEDMMIGGSTAADNNRGPIKEIALAVSLLVFGTLAILLGVFMAINKVGGDTAHGNLQLGVSPPFLFYFNPIYFVGNNL